MLAGVRESCGGVEGLWDAPWLPWRKDARRPSQEGWVRRAQSRAGPGRIWWLKGWIPGSGIQREGKAQEQELLLEGSGPPRVRGLHGALGRDVLGLKSGCGG